MEPPSARRSGCLPGCMGLLAVWTLPLLSLLRELIRHILGGRLGLPEERDRARPLAGCRRVPAPIYRRPDPLIYAQYHLMDQGLAVTWDNPDIRLERAGQPVASVDLIPGTDYEVVARIWNASNAAPAIDMPVRFSYLDFGIGTVSVPIAETRIDLPVNGAPGLPVLARVPWRTPDTPGHYCLQIQLVWGDDAQPANNLGQENVTVQALNSPHAAFVVPVRNPDRRRRTIRLEADTYQIPERRPCVRPTLPRSKALDGIEASVRQRALIERHGRDRFPLPEGWRVSIEPRELRLGPGAQQSVIVDVTAPDGFRGRQAINVNAFDEHRLIGGVTLYVDGSGE